MSTLTLVTSIVALFAIGILLFIFEKSRPTARDILPIVIISVVASIGRIIFAFLPSVQPVTAIVIIMGVCFGKRTGFITGCLCVLISNIYIGHGPWTPWQMLAWGIIGILAGVIGKFNPNLFVLVIFAFLSGFLYSLIVDIWTISTLAEGLTFGGAMVIFLNGLIYNVGHAIGNVVFMILLYKPLSKRLFRLKEKYGVLNS